MLLQDFVVYRRSHLQGKDFWSTQCPSSSCWEKMPHKPAVSYFWLKSCVFISQYLAVSPVSPSAVLTHLPKPLASDPDCFSEQVIHYQYTHPNSRGNTSSDVICTRSLLPVLTAWLQLGLSGCIIPPWAAALLLSPLLEAARVWQWVKWYFAEPVQQNIEACTYSPQTSMGLLIGLKIMR